MEINGFLYCRLACFVEFLLQKILRKNITGLFFLKYKYIQHVCSGWSQGEVIHLSTCYSLHVIVAKTNK